MTKPPMTGFLAMLTYLLSILFVLVCVLLVLVILVQRGRGGGLSGAFGMGGGGGGSAFGTKTGDVFTTVTVVLFAVFLLFAIGMNYRLKNIKQAPLIAPPPTKSPALPGLPGGDSAVPTPEAIPAPPATSPAK